MSDLYHVNAAANDNSPARRHYSYHEMERHDGLHVLQCSSCGVAPSIVLVGDDLRHFIITRANDNIFIARGMHESQLMAQLAVETLPFLMSLRHPVHAEINFGVCKSDQQLGEEIALTIEAQEAASAVRQDPGQCRDDVGHREVAMSYRSHIINNTARVTARRMSLRVLALPLIDALPALVLGTQADLPLMRMLSLSKLAACA